MEHFLGVQRPLKIHRFDANLLDLVAVLYFGIEQNLLFGKWV